VPLPNRTDTLLESALAVTRSGLPSLLKSPTASEPGLVPTPKLVAAPKPPVPLPSRMDMLLELKLATARSGLPSLSKSPTPTEIGPVPVPKLVAGPKLNAEHPTEGAACERGETGRAGRAMADPAAAEALDRARP